MEDYWTECQYYDIVWVCFVFGNCNHCCFCCGHPFTVLGVSWFISCKNKIQPVCVWKKNIHDVLTKVVWNLRSGKKASLFCNARMLIGHFCKKEISGCKSRVSKVGSQFMAEHSIKLVWVEKYFFGRKRSRIPF